MSGSGRRNADARSPVVGVRVPQVPQALVRRDKAFHVAPAGAVRGERAARQHHFEYVQELLRDLEISLIAGVMKGDQDLVGQTPAIARCCTGTNLSPGIVFSLAHSRPYHLLTTLPHLTVACLARRP